MIGISQHENDYLFESGLLQKLVKRSWELDS